MTEPQSVTLARKFLERRIDWVRPDSPLHGKRFGDLIDYQTDETGNITGRPILSSELFVELDQAYQGKVDFFCDGIANIHPNRQYPVIRLDEIARGDKPGMLAHLDEWIKEKK